MVKSVNTPKISDQNIKATHSNIFCGEKKDRSFSDSRDGRFSPKRIEWKRFRVLEIWIPDSSILGLPFTDSLFKFRFMSSSTQHNHDRLFWFLIFIALLGIPLLNANEDTPLVSSNRIESVQVGIEGFYKNGLWTPITVEWSISPRSNTAMNLTVSSVDSDGTPIEYRQAFPMPRPIEGPNAAALYFREILYAKLGRQAASLNIRIDAGNEQTQQQVLRPTGAPVKQRKRTEDTLPFRFFQPISCERPIYLVVGKEDIGLQGAIAELALREDRRPLLVKVTSFAELPDQWFGYEAVDMVVLTTTEPEQFAGLNSASPQIKALDDWIKLGGRLFFCAGKDSGPFLEPENGVLRPFLPGKFDKMTELRKNAPLEIFVGSERQIVMNGTPEAPFLQMPHFTEPRGIVFLKEIDLPLVLHCAHGLGTIVYFGGDLSGRPLSIWRDRVPLVKKILEWNKPQTITSRMNASLLQLGYNDISGQIRSALDRFESVRVVPVSFILVLLTFYWLAVGPLDWFVVHKILKKPVLTWVTFPFWILIFCGLAYYLAVPGRPNKVLLNELTLFDFDAETGIQRENCWANLYSPRDARYTLLLDSAAKQSADVSEYPISTLFSWNGLPGGGLGGMAPKTVSPTIWQEGTMQDFSDLATYHKPLQTVKDIPMQVRSTKSFFGHRWMLDDSPITNARALVQSQDQDQGCKVDLADEEGVLTGKLTLPQWLPTLENGLLIYGRWAQELGTLERGKEIKIDNKTTPRRELRDLLIPPSIQNDSQLSRIATYNTQATDLEYIARVFSLYGMLGGFEVIGLSNAFQKNLDMSSLFAADRAILIGTLPDKSSNFVGSCVTLQTGLVRGELEERNRKILVRVSLPIRLTELSPRIGGGWKPMETGELGPKIKVDAGPGGYEGPGGTKTGNDKSDR